MVYPITGGFALCVILQMSSVYPQLVWGQAASVGVDGAAATFFLTAFPSEIR